jgi:hypothetical protein
MQAIASAFQIGIYSIDRIDEVIFTAELMCSICVHFLLSGYRKVSAKLSEVVIGDAGHSPYIEKPAQFDEAFHTFLASVT